MNKQSFSMNRKLLIITLPVLALIVAAAFLIKASFSSKAVLSDKPEAKNDCSRVTGEATVIRDDEGFQPRESSVKVCSRVTFKNNSSQAFWPASNLHPTHGIYPEFDPLQGVKPGDSWSFVFDRVGRWRYHDHLAPVMTGVMNVTQ
jgi:plastocyanin